MISQDSVMRGARAAWRLGALPASLAALAAEGLPAASALAGGTLAERADAAVWASQSVVNGALALAAWAVALRRLDWRALPACAAAGSLLYGHGVLIGAGGLHGLLLAAGLYPAPLAHPATGFVNPQYGMLAAATVLLALLGARVAVPRWRTFDRAAVLAACLSVAATTALFHAHTMSAVSAMRASEEALALGVTRLPAPAWPASCRALGFRCVEFGPGGGPDVSRDAGVSAQASSVAAHALSRPGPFEHAWHGAASGGPHGVAGFASAARLEGGTVRVAHSEDRPSRFAEEARVAFAALAVPAHVTWLVGAVAVSALHARLPSFRARRRREACK